MGGDMARTLDRSPQPAQTCPRAQFPGQNLLPLGDPGELPFIGTNVRKQLICILRRLEPALSG